MIPNSDKLSDYLRYFFACYLTQHRDVSPNTIAAYKQSFMQLLRWWNLRFPQQLDPDLGQFQPAAMLDFLSYLNKTLGNSSTTRNNRLAAVKSFFKMVSLLQPRYQNQCRQILALPAQRTRRPKFDFLEKNEVDAVFASVDSQSQDGYRDLCILRTLYNTGARASELCAIRIADLNLEQKQVLLYGKGRKERTVPLFDSTTAFLRTYLKSERRVALTACRDSLFINQRRACFTRSGLYYLCSRYLAMAACKEPSIAKKKIHPVHGWRRTTASHLLAAGISLPVVQDWLGHVSIETTCHYKGISMQTKKEALRKFYLFEQSWQENKTEAIDWILHPDLLSFLESL
jgi:integrase/recombinase XerD